MTEALSVLDQIAMSIDEADDRADVEELKRLVAVLESMDKSGHSAVERAAIDYYLANAQSGLRKVNAPDSAWDWSQPYLEQEILHFRRALSELPSDASGDTLRSRVVTNLANALNHVGRVTEALELWERVLNQDEEFGMALANMGSAYFWYAKYVRPQEEQRAMLHECRHLLALALTTGVEEHALESIAELFQHVSSMLENAGGGQIPGRPYRADIGEQERKYRQWCRQQKLFLSYLNDLPRTAGVEDVQDNLVLPSIVLPLAEGGPELPVVYGMFNQAKQEYASARYMLYEAVLEREQNLHFADRGVLLYDALDYRLYRLWVERMKAAFLSAHAILDKLAYLMNWYWKLGLKPKEVSFSGVWYTKGKKRNGFAPSIERARQNLPLRGLFWLSKDFHENPAEGELAPEPRMLHDIRNHIAHKYLRVHDHIAFHLAADRSELPGDFSFQVSDEELQTYTVKLLRLVRSAMIYLSAAVLHEELDKKAAAGESLIAPMLIHTIDDQYRL